MVERLKEIYIAIVTSVIEEISRMSCSGCDDDVLMDYIQKNLDALECELNGDEYKKPKKRNNDLCNDCSKEMLIDYQNSHFVCANCGLCEYYPVYVTSYNNTMKPSRIKCFYKRSDNFKAILNRFFYGGKKLVPDDIMEAIRDEIHDETNIFYKYTIPITIPVLECILKRKELMMYKGSLYYIYFKPSGGSFPHITTKNII